MQKRRFRKEFVYIRFNRFIHTKMQIALFESMEAKIQRPRMVAAPKK
jgi:hypothetical protein